MKHCSKLSACALGLSLGLVGALSMLALGLLAWHFNVGKEMVALIGSLYVGFDATPKGALMGALWGGLDWLIGGLLIAWIYNCVLCCCSKKHCKSCGADPSCEPKHHEHHKHHKQE